MTDISRFLTILSPNNHRSTFFPILLGSSKIPKEQGFRFINPLVPNVKHGSLHWQSAMVHNIKANFSSISN
jgi:hypothetical protein